MIATERLFTGSIIEEQIGIELDAIQKGVERYRQLADDAVRRGDGAMLKPAERLARWWFFEVRDAVAKEQKESGDGKPGVGRHITSAPMQAVDADRIALITINTTLSWVMREPAGVTMNKLAYSIGSAVVAEAHADMLRKSDEVDVTDLDKRFRRLNTQRVNAFATRTLGDTQWGRTVRMHLGVRLVWCLITSARVSAPDEPFELAFRKRTVQHGKKTHSVVIPDRKVFDLIDEGHAARETMRPRLTWMIVRPLKWSEVEGGYLKTRVPLVAKTTPEQREAIRSADMTRVHERIDAIAGVPWRINRRVLEVMERMWEKGGGAMRVPARENEPIPPRPAAAEHDPDIKKAWKKEASKAHRRNAQLAGARFEFVNRLQEAKRFIDYSRIYAPYFLDFRTRGYPYPAHLNHQGDDVCRGMLEFANAVPVTGVGDFWLRVHAANCYGVDNVPFADRVAWTYEHADDIERSARDPDGCEFWRLADRGKKPWQFLGSCFALTDKDAAAHLPVQLDGTCNGLQHYAAMMRDEKGAALVNLLPGDSPQDVYSSVARAALVHIHEHAPESDRARRIVDMVKRDVVKQPVMTQVYGVTKVGARKQIQGKLKKLGLDGQDLYESSVYLTDQVKGAFDEVCPGAGAAMEYMRQCARLITREGLVVRWDTPIGFPVVQRYRRWRSVTIKTVLQELKMAVHDEDVPVFARRQIDGFAPNFVHSIDATHMLNTGLACHKEGIDYGAIHDCFISHAEHAGTMASIARNEFADLHAKPLINDLDAQLRERHPDIEFPEPPALGTLNIDMSRRAMYAFS